MPSGPVLLQNRSVQHIAHVLLHAQLQGHQEQLSATLQILQISCAISGDLFKVNNYDHPQETQTFEPVKLDLSTGTAGLAYASCP